MCQTTVSSLTQVGALQNQVTGVKLTSYSQFSLLLKSFLLTAQPYTTFLQIVDNTHAMRNEKKRAGQLAWLTSVNTLAR